MPKSKTNPVVAAEIAEILAQKIGLPPGNLWEPMIAHKIENELTANGRDEVLADWKVRLGVVIQA